MKNSKFNNQKEIGQDFLEQIVQYPKLSKDEETNYINLLNDVNNLKRDLGDLKEIVNKKKDDSIIVYEGNCYDGYSFINGLIKKAKESVIVIDGYADNSIFDFYIGSKVGIKKIIICHKTDRLSKEIIARFEKEYGEISIKEDKSYHDRFLIIDNEIIYHVGTSLNYLGNKTFIITKIEDEFWCKEFLKRIKEL